MLNDFWENEHFIRVAKGRLENSIASISFDKLIKLSLFQGYIYYIIPHPKGVEKMKNMFGRKNEERETGKGAKKGEKG